MFTACIRTAHALCSCMGLIPIFICLHFSRVTRDSHLKTGFRVWRLDHCSRCVWWRVVSWHSGCGLVAVFGSRLGPERIGRTSVVCSNPSCPATAARSGTIFLKTCLNEVLGGVHSINFVLRGMRRMFEAHFFSALIVTHEFPRPSRTFQARARCRTCFLVAVFRSLCEF